MTSIPNTEDSLGAGTISVFTQDDYRVWESLGRGYTKVVR